MERELLFDDASMSGGAQHLREAGLLLRQHTDALLATVRGSGTTAWGGSDIGMDMEALHDLLDEVCGHLHRNIDLAGAGMDDMAKELRLAEADAVAGAQAIDRARNSREI
ncbi:hypothetical protein [Nonomuraea recticatena]|uniref:WXG100 family type VII secretion target n=1 Tax=Nonomuraea recticatena TaxID=46178 RepID=A0ABN3R6F9_9ACTN